MRNKRALVSGCTSGIGLELVRGLARNNVDLILLGRDETKLVALTAELLELSTKPIGIDYFICDFENLSQVAAVSKLIEKAYRDLDIVVNNAGIWENKYRKESNGLELTWVVNYFAPFIITNNIMPLLKLTASETKDVRVINIASDAHRFGKIKFPLAQGFHYFRTYGATKLANVLHAFYLARLFKDEGISINAVHPGVVATDLWRKLPSFISTIAKKFMVTPEQGAKTALTLALSPNPTGTGRYFENMKSVVPSKDAINTELMSELFSETQKLLAEYLIETPV